MANPFKLGLSLGNGPSRAGIDMAALKAQGIVYGCNAMYKELEQPDVLVALDSLMISEIKAARYPGRTSLKKNGHAEFIMVDSEKGNIRLFRKNLTLSAGAVSLWLLSYIEGCTHIFIIGHDLTDPTDQLCPFFMSGLLFAVAPWKKVQFFRMVPPDCHIPPELGNLPNLVHIPPIASWFRKGCRSGELLRQKKEAGEITHAHKGVSGDRGVTTISDLGIDKGTELGLISDEVDRGRGEI